MSEPHWKDLPAGHELRQLVALRLGWHMRKIPVGSNGIEYDFFIYDNDDRIVYQREITARDLENEQAAVEQTWLAAMEDNNCPRWDEELSEALDLAYGMERHVWHENGRALAWVKSEAFTAGAETESLAVVRAWLAATENDPAYF